MIITLFNALLKKTILDIMVFDKNVNNIIYEYFDCIHMIDKVCYLDNIIVSNCKLCNKMFKYDPLDSGTTTYQIFGCPKLTLDEMALILVFNNYKIVGQSYSLNRKIKLCQNMS